MALVVEEDVVGLDIAVHVPQLLVDIIDGLLQAAFFSPRRFERAIRKRPNTVRCLAVKRALLGTRHPRKEKEAALQNIIGEPACLCGEITMCHTTGDSIKN